MDFTLSSIFPLFLCGLYVSVKSGLYCIRFLRDVKTEHFIIFICIKQWFVAITFYRAAWCNIILCRLEGHVGKEGYFNADFVSYIYSVKILTLLSLHCHFRTVRR